MRLSRRLTLEERARAADGAGGASVTWVALGTLWARMDARTGAERVVEGLDAARQHWRITVRGAPPGAASR